MKNGEKLALRIVLIVFVSIVGFTVYLELDYRKTSPLLNTAKTVEPNRVVQERVIKPGLSKGVIPKGITPNDLPDAESRGATILTIYCAQCHDLPTPTMHSSAEWPAILTRMQSHLKTSRNGMLRHIILPPEKDWHVLESYLTNNAQTSLNPLKYDDIASVSGKAFTTTCSQCHTAPSPKAHTRNEWPRVVLRMKANMLAANIPTPKQETLLTIIDFLQRHSKNPQ